MFLLPCQTLQGKHYRLNCLIPICIIRRSDNCKNRDAKGRLRAAYACCQPFAIGKAKLRTRARTSSPAGSQLSSHSLPGNPSHPRSFQTPALAGFSLPSGGVPNRTAPPRFFIHGLSGLEPFRGAWWHELPLKTRDSKMLHALGMETCPLPCIANK